jgi:predicted HTH transcriptional regulator
MNNGELCQKLSLSSKTIAVKLAKLRNLGIISWIGHKSHGYWQVNIKS